MIVKTNRLKEEHAKLKQEAVALNNQSDDLDRAQELKNEEVKLKAVEYCLEAGLLEDISWRFSRAGQGEAQLEAHSGECASKEEISQLFWTSWHSSFPFKDSITVEFDDGAIALNFGSISGMFDFCKERKMKIDASTLVEELDTHKKNLAVAKKQIESLEKFIEEMKEISCG